MKELLIMHLNKAVIFFNRYFFAIFIVCDLFLF